jgi:single-strand DNA-binding protein
MSNMTYLEGNLTHDPESNFTQSGQQVTNLRMATNRRFTRQDGTSGERTEFHRIVSWNQAGAAAALKKGRRVMVRGELQTRSWEDKDGNKRYTTELVASCIAPCLPYQRQSGRPQTPREDEEVASSESDSKSEDFDGEVGF